jgi:hypothetical protein
VTESGGSVVAAVTYGSDMYDVPRPVEPVDIDLASDELTTLTQFLDFHRSVLAHRSWGLSQSDLARALAPSNLTLGGLLKHMTYVEDWWFDHRFVGNEPSEPWASADWDSDPDWEMTTAADDTPKQLFDQYDESCKRSRAIAEAATLDQLTARANGDGIHWNMRWILVHMIEEYARHCGHADFIRQSIDGQVG